MRISAHLALAAVLICTGMTNAVAASDDFIRGQIIRTPDEDHSIAALELDSTEVLVHEVRPEGKLPYFSAHVEGRMTQAGWNLVHGKNWLLRPGSPSLNFAVDVPLEGERTVMRLSAFDMNGNITDESVTITLSEAEYRPVQETIERWRAEAERVRAESASKATAAAAGA
ncbi:MAG: hypothetical protein ACXWP5_14210, partial [Bdellovibrionota bacterium]